MLFFSYKNMKLITVILASLLVLATSSRVIHKNAPSESPSTDCSTIIYDMMDCVSFLSEGSEDNKPSSSCCTGVESVLSADPKCLCVAMETSNDMGIVINMTRAVVLPKTCGLSAPPLSKCDLPKPPSHAPGKAPSRSPVEPPAEPPTQSPDTPAQPSAEAPSHKADAPAPAPGRASHSVPAISIVFISLLLSFVGFSFLV